MLIALNRTVRRKTGQLTPNNHLGRNCRVFGTQCPIGFRMQILDGVFPTKLDYRTLVETKPFGFQELDKLSVDCTIAFDFTGVDYSHNNIYTELSYGFEKLLDFFQIPLRDESRSLLWSVFMILEPSKEEINCLDFPSLREKAKKLFGLDFIEEYLFLMFYLDMREPPNVKFDNDWHNGGWMHEGLNLICADKINQHQYPSLTLVGQIIKQINKS